MLVPKGPRDQVLRTQSHRGPRGKPPEEVASELELESRVSLLRPRGTDGVGETKTRVETQCPWSPQGGPRAGAQEQEGQRGRPHVG